MRQVQFQLDAVCPGCGGTVSGEGIETVLTGHRGVVTLATCPKCGCGLLSRTWALPNDRVRTTGIISELRLQEASRLMHGKAVTGADCMAAGKALGDGTFMAAVLGLDK